MPLIMFVSSSFNTYVNLPKKKKRDGKTITLVPLSPKQVYDDQMKLKKECEDGKSENSREDNGERKPSDSAKPKSLIKPVESGGKNRGVKRVSLCDDNSVAQGVCNTF